MTNKLKLKSLLNEKIMTSSLVAKWMPRPNVGNRERKREANVLRNYLRLSPKDYRKKLVELSNTVEQLMCSKNWTAIEYSKLPSKAMSDYMKAFSKNDLARFQAYLTSLEKGETKINAGAVYPYDIIKNLNYGSKDGADQQWKALPNYMLGNNERLLPVVDTSGSMSCSAGGNALVRCIDVAISLGMYISERNVGIFKDAFVTFSTNPKLQILSGKLSERYNQLARAEWHGSTNLEATFNLILGQAKRHSVPVEEMPTMVLILSDMEFNPSVVGGWNPTAQEMIRAQYAAAGYTMPKIVYWNLNAKNTDSPVHFDTSGTALVSGFSSSLLKNLLEGKDLSPISMMKSVIDSERYSVITL